MSILEQRSVIEPSEAAVRPDGRARTYEVRTFGCQMNVHDSERLSGSLEAAGYVPANGEEADIVVINTCAVRENADNKLYGNLGHLANVKRRHEGMQIAVGGCLAQKDKNVILEKAPWVDVVFGTHNMGSLPSLLERARHNDAAEIEILESLETFPSTLPTKRDSSYSGWVSISVGCNNTCTFCIVPSLRGKEKDRRPGDILAEIQALVDDGAIEVTLLGQNVNSYGVEFGDRQAFSKLLRAAGQIEGLERIRFTSPHPAAFTDDVIDAMAETPNVMPQLHMPLQSGSDRILRSMRRSYRSEKFLGILDRVRAKLPDAAISTDIIVGFPGETEEDFQETLRVVEAARFASAFTFQYSIRPGTPAATMADQVPKEIVQDRYDRLIALQERISLEENQALIGREVELLVANGEGRKDADTHRLSGRARDSRLVHFEVPAGSDVPRPGDVVTVGVTQAAPHYLIADSSDGAPLRIRRTRAGEAWDRAEAESCAVPSHGSAGAATGGRVSLGLPELRVGLPAPLTLTPRTREPLTSPGVGTMPIYDPTDGQR
ncbi:tRNA (N6-isopentenyl adenosine(37)-C2)-methylthiotransferase MiaB [Leifsonia sp. 22587]|uniref:tRNA (N6-isopentenyl adenosine(37)-C2)-methylthiotransferase MiaB n=1 Tax=Leifsonia sp. 22587 TaxID=3453946 RepID=UPI003F87C93E